MNTIESITASRVVSLAHLNLTEATAWAMHAKARGVLPVGIAQEIENVRFLLEILDDGDVSDQEALTVLQRACILYGQTLGLSGGNA